MILKEFEVRSYRSCQNTKFPINKDLTGLIGINGSGKTNVLNAILLLKKISENRHRYLRVKDTEFNSCRIGAVLEHDKITIKLNGSIKIETDDRNNDETIYSELKWNFSNYKEDEWFEIPFDFFPFRNESSHYFISSRIRPHLRNAKYSKEHFVNTLEMFDDKIFKKKVSPLLNKIYIFFNEINYYSATQFSNPNRCPVSIELEENRPRRKMYSSSGHEQFIFDLYNSKQSNDKEYIRYFNTVSKNGIGLIDDFDFEKLPIPSSTYQVQSGGKIRQKNDERLLIVPIFTIDDKRLSPNQLSEGTFKTLALLYYAITDKSKLLLVEEPEVCIHHGLLDSIIKLIIYQSKQKQIIISTHSDFVLDHLSPENILLVRYLKSKGTTVKQLNKTMSKGDYSALKKYLKDSGNLGEYWREGGFEYD